MENILDQYESDGEAEGHNSSLNKSQELKGSSSSSLQRQSSNASEADETDNDFDDVAMAIEENLLKGETENDESDKSAVGKFSSDDEANDKKLSNDISFDEDIILPGPRCDFESEQRERDRQKRKEMKSRKELEEEEREKMQ